MTQLFSVAIDGQSVTDQVKSVTLSYSLGRVINSGSITMMVDPKVYVGKDIMIIHGDNTFNGFISNYQRSTLGTFIANVRSLGGKLAEPFFISAHTVDYATTASDLCNEYSVDSGVPITYNATALNFGGSWVRESTPADELIRMCAVMGSDISDSGSGLIIEDVKPVAGIATVIDANEIIDFHNIGDTIDTDGLGFVTTMTGQVVNSPSTGVDRSTQFIEDAPIIAEQTIVADIDDVSGRVDVYISPSSMGADPIATLDSYSGMTEVFSGMQYIEQSFHMIGSSDVTTYGAIQSIESATINGVDVDNYDYVKGTNVISFNSPQDGMLKVGYYADVRQFTLDTESTPAGEFYNIEAVVGSEHIAYNGVLDAYVTDDVPDFDGYTDDSASINDAFGYKLFNGTDYVDGFILYTYGQANLDLYSGSTKLPTGDKITTTDGTYTRFVDAKLTKVANGDYRAYIDVPVASIQDVTSAGTTIPYTAGTDGDGNPYLGFTQYYPNVQVEYAYDGQKHVIKYPYDDKQQTLVINDEIDIPLTTDSKSWDDPSAFPCGYPADFPFNVAKLLNIPIEDCVGKNIVGMNAPVDSKGYAYATITQDGLYEYDTSSIKGRTSITLRANSNGSL